MSFSVTGAHVRVVSFFSVYPFIGAGAHGWVVDTAVTGVGLGCWPTIGLF